MHKLLFTYTAEKDLDAIYQYIAKDSATRAHAYVKKIQERILSLQEFPNIGALARYPELASLGIHILPFKNYLIFYTVNAMQQTVTVLRILNGSVNYKKLF